MAMIKYSAKDGELTLNGVKIGTLKEIRYEATLSPEPCRHTRLTTVLKPRLVTTCDLCGAVIAHERRSTAGSTK